MICSNLKVNQLMNKWNVCNLVFVIMLQKNMGKFPISISEYFTLTPNIVEGVSFKMNQIQETYIKRTISPLLTANRD